MRISLEKLMSLTQGLGMHHKHLELFTDVKFITVVTDNTSIYGRHFMW